MKGFIAAFSYIFHPLFIPVYATLFYFAIAHSFFYNNEIYLIFIQVLIVTVLLPICVFFLLRSLGRIKSKVMLDNRERLVPLSIYALLLFFMVQYSFSMFRVAELYFYFIGILVTTLSALFLALLKHKASLHMAGIASLTMFIISISAYYHIHLLYLIIFLVLCCGFVSSSRLQTGKHSFGETVLGLLIGIIPQIALWYFWLLPNA
jgi:hypothetical protein